MYKITNTTSILRLADGACIPADKDNNDYADYLKWLAKGNTPLPADVPDPKQIALSKISMLESQNMLPRVVREFMLEALVERATKAGVNPNTLPAYVKCKLLDDEIAALRAKL